MFTVEERDRVRERLLALADADPVVVGAAITGSFVADASDQWSDIDLAFAIDGETEPTVESWTTRIYDELEALHHWDLRWRATVYRVFLLASGLEVDIAFTPKDDFGPRGPKWRTVFGETVEHEPTPPQDRDELVGLAWHHVLHARACIERGKPWQTEWLIGGIREYVLALACLRLGHETRYARGADLLPPEVTEPMKATLVRSLDQAELRRALAAAADALASELEQADPALASQLRPILELTAPEPEAGVVLKALDEPDRSWTFLGGSERVAVELGSYPIGLGVYRPAWRWSKHVQAISGQESEEHVGYVLSGRMIVRSRDGLEVDVGPGDAFVAAAGHDAWVVGDEACVALDFISL